MANLCALPLLLLMAAYVLFVLNMPSSYRLGFLLEGSKEGVFTLLLFKFLLRFSGLCFSPDIGLSQGSFTLWQNQ